MIRGTSVPINYHLLRQCREVAKLRGIPCAEDLIELWLSEKLAGMPEIAELCDSLSTAEKTARKAWLAKYGTKTQEDALPL